VFVDLVDQHIDFPAYLLCQTRGGDGLLMRHEALPSILLDLVGNMVGQFVGACANDRRILEAPYAIQLSFGHPVQQVLEVFFGFTRQTYDESRAQGQVRTDLAPALDARHGAILESGTLHGFQYLWTGMLEGYVQIRQYLAFSHQRDDLINMGVGINVVQPCPDAKVRQGLA